VRLARVGCRGEAAEVAAAAQGTAAPAADRDDGARPIRDLVAASDDRDVRRLLGDLDARLLESVAPVLEPGRDKRRPRRVRQEEANVGAAQAQRRISS
jgi:hypothetical protein